MRKYKIPIKILFEKLDILNKEYFEEIPCEKNFFVKMPDGNLTKILGFIKKPKNKIIEFDFGDFVFSCSENHLLLENGKLKKAKNIEKTISTILGERKFVVKYIRDRLEDVFDICIEMPNLYVNQTLIHHNTFFIIETLKQWFTDNPTGIVMFFESESAISKEMLVSRGVDVNRIVWLPVITVQETRTQAIKILDKYLAISKDKRIPMMFILDSLGMLSTTKEILDTEAGKETQDMTRAKLIKSMFRVLTLKLGRACVPFLVTNHTYMETGLFAKKQMGGGCLVDGSKIRIPSYDIGKYEYDVKNINNIKKDEIVNTYLGEDVVSNTFSFNSDNVYELEFEDGFKVQCTGTHKFLVKDKEGEIYWENVECLSEGTIILKV